jgi:hypothetical protein
MELIIMAIMLITLTIPFIMLIIDKIKADNEIQKLDKLNKSNNKSSKTMYGIKNIKLG